MTTEEAFVFRNSSGGVRRGGRVFVCEEKSDDKATLTYSARM